MSETLSPKVYVAVKVEFNEIGIMLPREITWEDGTRYEIDTEKHPNGCRLGGVGLAP